MTPRTDVPEVPEYLSGEWWNLPPDDWRRQAAITIAANRWHVVAQSAYGWHLLDEASDWHRRRTFSDWSSTVAEMVQGRTLISYQELQRRRAVLGPHYRPHCGGPVDWHTGRPARREAA